MPASVPKLSFFWPGAGLIFAAFIGVAGAHGQSVWLRSSKPTDLHIAQVSIADLASPAASIAAADTAIQTEVPLPASEAEASAPAAATGAEVANTPRRFHYAIRFTARSLYDDNINISQTNRASDLITTFEPAILLGFGDTDGHQENYLLFNYAPSLFIYANHSEADAFQQLAHLEGQYSMSRLTLKVSQDVQILDGNNLDIATGTSTVNDRVNLDAGQRTRADIFTTRLDASYYLAGKTFLSAGIAASVNHYSTLISSEAISANGYLNYVYSPKLTFGVGGGVGYNVVDGSSPDQTSEQISVRMNYQATGKLTFSGSGGVEFRQFSGEGRGTFVSPVFDLTAEYQPFDGTSISLSANRRTQNSALLSGEDFSSTDFTVSAKQRLLRRFAVGLTIGYENADYFSTVASASSNRTDNYFFVQPSLDAQVTRFWTVGAYYLHRNNDSSPASYSFYDNQVGLRTSLTF